MSEINSVRLQNEVKEIITTTNILNFVNFNNLVNYSLLNTIPELIKDNDKLKKFLEISVIARNKFNRNLILIKRREEKSKFYFFSRFISEWNKLLDKPYKNDILKKERLLNILNIYIEESETYPKNELITNTLKKYAIALKNTKYDTETLKALFEVSIVRLDKKQTERNYKRKIENINKVIKK